MSKLGEKADTILEMLNERGCISKKALKKRLSFEEKKIFDFLEEYGLIETNMDYICITKAGKELLTAGLPL